MGEIVDSLLVMTNLNGMRRGGPQFVHWECADWREKVRTYVCFYL